MGKKNFQNIYRKIRTDLGGPPTCKISYFSDRFDPSRNYAGAIIYMIDGNCKWHNNADGGKAKGYDGKSFYLIIQSTNDWPPENLKNAGQGRVHDYLLKNVLGIDFNQNRVACGGFAFVNGTLRFSSIWLNQRNQTGTESDGDKMLSELEQVLVEYCFEQYQELGTNTIFSLPSYLDCSLLYRNPRSLFSLLKR